MIDRMRFVEIAGPIAVFDVVLDVLQQTGVMHLEDIPTASESRGDFLHKMHLTEEQARQLQTYEELVKLLTEEGIAHVPRSLVSRLTRSEEFARQYQQWSTSDDPKIITAARAVHAQVRSFARRRRNLDDDIRMLAVYEEVAEALVPLLENNELPKGYEFVGVVFERKNLRARSLLKQQIEKLTSGQFRFFQAQLKAGRVAALVGYNKKHAQHVRKFISETGISEIRGPRQLRDKTFEETFIKVQQDLSRLRKEQRKLSEQSQQFFSAKASLLLVLKAVCDDRLSRLNAITKFVHTKYTFIMHGWVPVSDIETFSQKIQSACQEPVVIRKLQSNETVTSPPVRLSNSGPVRQFEYLLGLFPLPRYGTIDPTSYVAVFFPPMFGLMLADIGYGLILISGGLYLRLRRRSGKLARALGTVLSWCAFYTILFGLVFGEFFGTLGHHLGLRPIWRERLVLEGPDKTGAILSYLMLAVSVGIAHILCGLLLGIFNAHRTGQKGKALEYGGRMIGIVGLFLIVGRLAHLLPDVFSTIGVVILIAFFVSMVVSMIKHPMHGMILPLELLSTVGNILSYARIMAVGVASAVLALLANQFGSAIDNIILAVIVMVLIHSLNLVLGIVDPTIQGLRLHYVEFFSKFYLTGGRAYSPFRMKGDM